MSDGRGHADGIDNAAPAHLAAAQQGGCWLCSHRRAAPFPFVWLKIFYWEHKRPCVTADVPVLVALCECLCVSVRACHLLCAITTPAADRISPCAKLCTLNILWQNEDVLTETLEPLTGQKNIDEQISPLSVSGWDLLAGRQTIGGWNQCVWSKNSRCQCKEVSATDGSFLGSTNNINMDSTCICSCHIWIWTNLAGWIPALF